MSEPSSPGPARKRRWRIPVVAGAVLALTAGIAAFSISTANAATINTNAWYVFVNRFSGKAMDVWEWSTANGGAINQFTRLDGANQQFRFVSSGSGYYRLLNRNSGKVIDVAASSTADGATVDQWTDNNGANQQFSVLDSDSGYVRFVNRNSGKALDLWGWNAADGARISQYTDLNGTNQQWQMISVGTVGSTTPTTPSGGGTSTTGLVGWATQGGGTTGGGSAASTTVTSSSALTTALAASAAANIRISGIISCSGMLKVASNKTVTGVGSNSGVSGCGFNVANASNVIIRNLRFTNANDDSINVQYSTRVWIDHNDLSNGYDGLIDIKRSSDYVTVSWNHLHNHDKSMLLGHDDGNSAEDVGHLRVTYHHNWLDGTNQRHPRVRFGNPVHVFNNYYANIGSYGVASTMNAGVLVEGNYFENVDDPWHRGEGDSGPGSIVARNNTLVGSGSGDAGGSVASIPYSYSMDPSANVKSIVTASAGVGKIGL